jgi:hypothetical protein
MANYVFAIYQGGIKQIFQIESVNKLLQLIEVSLFGAKRVFYYRRFTGGYRYHMV